MICKVKCGENGKLFGAISTKEIAAAAKEQLGYDIDKKKMQLKDAIKSPGVFFVSIKLHTKVVGELKVHVTEA